MTLPNTRPASWNFKMLSGEPLITDAQFERLLANGLRQQPPMAAPDDLLPVLKIFLPHFRWLLVRASPEGVAGAFAEFDSDRAIRAPEGSLTRQHQMIVSRHANALVVRSTMIGAV
jgi:hypothetical protein